MAKVTINVKMELEEPLLRLLVEYASSYEVPWMGIDDAVADCVRSWLTLGDGAKLTSEPQKFPENGSTSTVVSDSDIPFGNGQTQR
jgi:hypothetical protein